jgi:hypothetical protein
VVASDHFTHDVHTLFVGEHPVGAGSLPNTSLATGKPSNRARVASEE